MRKLTIVVVVSTDADPDMVVRDLESHVGIMDQVGELGDTPHHVVAEHVGHRLTKDDLRAMPTAELGNMQVG